MRTEDGRNYATHPSLGLSTTNTVTMPIMGRLLSLYLATGKEWQAGGQVTRGKPNGQPRKKRERKPLPEQ
jgi:hypothetical protein